MKVFHLTLEFDLEEKAPWVDTFRKKYKEQSNYHITLKYPTIISESKLAELKNEIKMIAMAHKVLIVEFDRYFFDKTKNGNLIMVLAKHNENLNKLQKTVIDKLSGFGKSIKPNYKDFERNFKPHIALARKLSDESFLEARKQLKRTVYCKARITKLALTIVNKNATVEEIYHSDNVSYYYLDNNC